MSKPTPGPWYRYDTSTGKKSALGLGITANNRGCIAIIQGTLDEKIMHADADLIAAAPDLLDALEDMTGRFERCCRYTDSADEEMLAAITKPIRELIAKAKGE